MTEIEELRLAYAESSRQKNELLTAHKLAAAENAALRERVKALEDALRMAIKWIHLGVTKDEMDAARAALGATKSVSQPISTSI
jgi:hypothetical protein